MRKVSLLLCLAVLLAAGCAQTKLITITTMPPDATIRVDGMDAGRSPTIHEFHFANADDVHEIAVAHAGYKEQRVQVLRGYERGTLHVELRPLTRRVRFAVGPVAGLIKVNGRQVTANSVQDYSTDLEFTADEKGTWTSYIVTAERPGFAGAQVLVNWADPSSSYTLTLHPMRKDLAITTDPAGAAVALDGAAMGTTPMRATSQPFIFNAEANQWTARKVRLSKPGYDPVEYSINWDNGRSEYHFMLSPRSKNLRIATQPPGARVMIDGKELLRDRQGVSLDHRLFPPVDEAGTLKSYTAKVTLQSTDSLWESADVRVGWDDGQVDYTVALKEILTRQVELIAPLPQRNGKQWDIVAKRTTTRALKDADEPSGISPTPVPLPDSAMPDTIAVSADGKRLLVVSLLTGGQRLKSRLLTVPTDGRRAGRTNGGVEELTDGKSLDLTATYTLDGLKILFSSDRAGSRFKIFRIPASTSASAPAGGVTQLTTAQSGDLWPTIDADPKPRMYFQAMVDTLGEPRIYMATEGDPTRTELTQMPSFQPHVSPRGDWIVFTSIDDKTGKRDIWRVSDKGGKPQNLTQSPEVDESDPAWNSNGSRLAYASDAGTDEHKVRNSDIWVMDADGKNARQITANGSHDDAPAWDPAGTAIYFRSNRTGHWGVWRIAVR